MSARRSAGRTKSGKADRRKKDLAMAKRGKEIALQQVVETQEEWEDMMGKEGLCVIDVYQEWGGPTNSMQGHFRKIKNELGDPLLKFIIAKADTVDALEKYRGRCEPCFLFFAGGSLVAVIRGANAPLILRTITEQLAQEHKVLEGNTERKPIKDTVIDQLEARDREKEEEEEEQEALRMQFQGEIVDFGDDLESRTEPKKEVSVVIIKPDAVQSGQAEAILEEMEARGIEILRKEERQLTEDEVKNIYIHLQDEPFFEDLVAFMTSSPSIVLAITKGKTGENIVNEFRELMGPTEVEEAKEQKPESLRAKFGSEKFMNAVHGSDSTDTAARELAFLFPEFVAPAFDGEPKIQRTLALIRPDAYKKHKDEIIAKIREAGFKIAMQKEIHLDKEQAEDFYKEHKEQEYFEELTTRMSSGPLLALGLAREEAVAGWRQMLGPTKVEEAQEQQPDSLRAQFVEEGVSINMFHGSDSEDTAQKELEFFFPMEQTVAVIKPDAYGTKDEIIDKIHESGFRIAAHKETTLSREIAEEFYQDHKDKDGPTYFMVLSREGAVDGWRSLIGPTDPEEAKDADPDTIRGKFGKDKLQNAVHGSSTKDHAMTSIAKIFGELHFNKDGTVKEDKEEVAISEQQQINYEVAPEYRDSSDKNVKEEPKETQAQEEQKDSTTEQEPAKEEQKAEGEQEEKTEKSETEAKAEESEQAEAQGTEEKAKTPEPSEQQPQEQQKPTEEEKPSEEQTPAEQSQEQQPSTEQKPADEGQEQKEEEKPQETQEKAEEPQAQAEEPKKEEEPAKQETEQAPEEPKQEEQKQEEAPPAQQEEAKEEEKPAESEKKEETTEQAEAKPEEQKAE